jgi:4-amino-4-deoxy-L-arabinose transferase-like glycosyltransferase
LVLIIWTISNISKWPRKWWVVGLLVAAFTSGHWWLYPENRSNGWDVTLAHLPYHENRKALLQELEANGLSMESVASAFPLFCSTQQTDLIPGDRMSDLSEVKIEDMEVLIYSPICNDISTSENKNWFKSHHLVYIIGSAHAATRIEVYRRKSEE